MTTLARAVALADAMLVVSPALASSAPYPIALTIDSEKLLVNGGNGTTTLYVSRGQDGSSAATHAIGATVTAGWGGGSGGGVNVDPGDGMPVSVTTLVAPGADVSVPGQATVATVWQRNVGQAEYDYNGPGTVNGSSDVPVALTFADGDEGLVDLTNPAAPLIINPGVYAFTVFCAAAAAVDDLKVRLLIDDNYYSINAVSALGALPTATADCSTGASVTWYCDDNDPFTLYVRASALGVAVNVVTRLLIQRVS